MVISPKEVINRTQHHGLFLSSLHSLKKKISLQEALDLLQNLPSEISDVLTNDFSWEEVPANNLLEFLLDS
ncbi:hypothetical protein TNCV_3904901 [Trichonephila clavipes]|nr:hypothetical protein TNCV_3904901 [Trichonephila clavipes]